MIDKQFELCDRFDLDDIGSGTTIVTAASLSASINEYDFGGASHQNALSSIRVRAELSSDSAQLAGATITLVLQDAADSSGSSGTYASIMQTKVWAADSTTPAGTVLLDIGLPLNLRQWFRVSLDHSGAVTSTTYLSMYLYTLR